MRNSDTDSNQASSRKIADRVISQDNAWFYHTREGLRGPFESRSEAEKELAHFIKVMLFIENDYAPFEIDPTDVTILNLGDTTPF